MEQQHFGVANIAISGDEEKGLAYVIEAQALLRIALEQMRVRQITQFSMQRRFSDDVYCYVVCAAGLNMVRIVAGYGESPQGPGEPLKYPVDIPDFLSGAVNNGLLQTVTPPAPAQPYDVMSQFHPTLACAKLLSMPQNFQTVKRLTVEPYDDFQGDLSAPEDSPQRYSQYRKLKPTMYSGRMKRVVQVLMGFGKQEVDGNRETSIYDSTDPKPKSKKKPPALTTYQKDVQKKGLQIRYDWRFMRTHGITTAADGRLWLVEVGITQGVLAYPLPLNAKTQDPTFRDKLTKMGDTAGLAVLDELGGWPTGETLPEAEQVDAWVRAGKLLRLCSADDMGVFYNLASAYGSWMGWAFSLDGGEAHNTGYYYDSDGVMHGVHYMVPLSIGGTTDPEDHPERKAMVAGFEAIRSKNPDTVDAAKFKVNRLDDFDYGVLLEVFNATNNGPQLALDQIDAMTLPPIAAGNAHLSKVMDGYLYNASKTGNLIKFPEPEIGLLLSVQMRPNSARAMRVGSAKRCDTTVHVHFRENELKWVKYYRDPDGSGVQGGTTNDYEECMYVGTWTSHTDSGTLKVTNALYSNDMDDRAEYPAGSSDTKIVSIDMGYSSIQVADDIMFPAYGHATRYKRFKRTTTTKTITGQGLNTGIIVPFYDREAYYYASYLTDQGSSTSIAYQYTYLTDPYSCNTWRNFPGYIGTWYGTPGVDGGWWLAKAVQHPNGCGGVTARTVWANPTAPIYSPTDCGDYADSGPWCFVCDNIDNMMYQIPEPPLPPDTNVSPPVAAHLKVFLCATDGPILTFMNDAPSSFGQWPLHSPDANDGISSDQYAECTHNAMGGADVMRYSTNVNAGLTVRGAPDWPGIESGTLTFVGVVDG